MAGYNRNKLRTAWQITQRIENWPTAFGLRINQHRRRLKLLNFRNRLNIVCRGGTRDWDVIHELHFAGSYGRAMNFLKAQPGEPVVLDLGGNIGLFSLLAAQSHPAAQIHAYEPGPPNFQVFEMNCLANPNLSRRIRLRKEAVAGQSRTAEWFFDEENPGGSGFFGTKGSKYQVQIRAGSEVLEAVSGDIALAKIDIEGSEYDLLRHLPEAAWRRIKAISLELHDDPEGKLSSAEFMKRMEQLGFTVESETVASYFLHR
jgi:FkbM family methyltransferase